MRRTREIKRIKMMMATDKGQEEFVLVVYDSFTVSWTRKCPKCGRAQAIGEANLAARKFPACNGCFRRKLNVPVVTLPEYPLWIAMKQRCYNPKQIEFKNYGGRGITVCDQWRNSFLTFFKDMGSRPSADYSLDRIDNSKGYSPENCRWATRKEQCRNFRRNRLLMINGKSIVLAEAAEKLGVTGSCIRDRLIRGWDIESAVTVPSKQRGIKKCKLKSLD